MSLHAQITAKITAAIAAQEIELGNLKIEHKTLEFLEDIVFGEDDVLEKILTEYNADLDDYSDLRDLQHEMIEKVLSEARTDFKDVSIFDDVVQFTVNGTEYKFEQNGTSYRKAFILNGDSWIYEGTILSNSSNCVALYNALINSIQD